MAMSVGWDDVGHYLLVASVGDGGLVDVASVVGDARPIAMRIELDPKQV